MRSASRTARSDAGGALFPGRAGQRDARKRGAKPFMRAATRLPSLLFFRTGYRITQKGKSEFMRLSMKTLYLIGGTMGVGKTTVGQQLKKDLNNSVFLDGDWCWDASPFQVTDETKAMVIRNICYLLNSFVHCSVYENIIFCWVMHEQSIIDSIINELDTENCIVKKISLIVDEINLQNRLKTDVAREIRTADVIDRSVARIFTYQTLDTIKIETSNKTVREIVDKIMAL